MNLLEWLKIENPLASAKGLSGISYDGNNSTLTDSFRRMIFQLFHPDPKGRKQKNQPFPLGFQGKKG